jgi:hypothetical protein
MRHSAIIGLALMLANIAGLAAAAEPEVGAPELPCQGRLQDFEPRSASAETFHGRDAVLFYEALAHRNQPIEASPFDTVVIRSGQDVFGGMVALIAKGDCVVAYAFLSAIDYLDASSVVKLYSDNVALRQEAHLDLVRLRALADDGNPLAAFHTGLTLALGWGVDKDRRAGIASLQRAAASGYEPAMLALGLALSGKGNLEDEVKPLRQPPEDDEFTDLVQACVWLRTAADAKDVFVRNNARQEWEYRALESAMTREERAECRRQLRARPSNS